MKPDQLAAQIMARLRRAQARLAENADFGLSDMDAEPSPAAPVQSRPASPTRTKQRTPARNDDDEDRGASSW